MSYTDLSDEFDYKDLLTWQNMDALGENDKEMYISGNFAFAPVKTRYYSMGAGDFVMQSNGPAGSSQVWNRTDGTFMRSPSTTLSSAQIAGVHLPHGATVTSFKVWWNNAVGGATGEASLFVSANYGSPVTTMATADSTPGAGQHTAEDTSISSATVANDANKISVYLAMDPVSLTTDIYCYMIVITYTVTTPLP